DEPRRPRWARGAPAAGVRAAGVWPVLDDDGVRVRGIAMTVASFRGTGGCPVGCWRRPARLASPAGGRMEYAAVSRSLRGAPAAPRAPRGRPGATFVGCTGCVRPGGGPTLGGADARGGAARTR